MYWLRLPQLRLEGRHVGADALRVDAEIAAALAALRAHVDAAPGSIGGDTDDEIVGEAHEECALASLDAAGGGIVGDDRPARHRLRRGKRALEGLGRR